MERLIKPTHTVRHNRHGFESTLGKKQTMEKNPRNILVSAIACSPVLGSEDGVGWNWSLELSKLGNSVTVLTRKRFRTDIEDYLKKEPNPGLSFSLHRLVTRY